MKSFTRLYFECDMVDTEYLADDDDHYMNDHGSRQLYGLF